VMVNHDGQARTPGRARRQLMLRHGLVLILFCYAGFG
jgi:hypothetical protein